MPRMGKREDRTNGAAFGLEATLWAAGDNLRGKAETTE